MPILAWDEAAGSAMIEEFGYLIGLSLVVALGVGVPVRLFGWRPVWTWIRTTIGRYRWYLLGLLILGALIGAWSFEDVRGLIGQLLPF